MTDAQIKHMVDVIHADGITRNFPATRPVKMHPKYTHGHPDDMVEPEHTERGETK